MTFNKHSDLAGQHALLGASKPYWLRYDDAKLEEVYLALKARQLGTDLHDLARRCIELGRRQPNTKESFNRYVNDAIGFKMTPEQVLKYSYNCFGTADSICFSETKRLLRIHDYKSGENPGDPEQLEVYEALFCLEYDEKPEEIESELRIYQFDEPFRAWSPDPKDIRRIMNKIISSNKILERMKAEV